MNEYRCTWREETKTDNVQFVGRVFVQGAFVLLYMCMHVVGRACSSSDGTGVGSWSH